ncbi:MAG: NAD(P)H-hydrate dehydratase, partial [Lachnospiraceae bacterium]
KEQEKIISDELQKIADWADVIAVGPGLSTDDYAKKVVETLLFETNKPLILDADAINILAHDKTMQARLSESRKNEQSKRILFMTPHPLELARLLGVSVEEIRKNRIEILKEASKRYRAIIVSKDADTIICDAQENLYINSTGNDALATAGTGDVLTGLLASIVAQYLKKETIPYEDESSEKNKYFYAACMAVYLHGKAGDTVSKNYGNGYVTAGDLIKQYPDILK